MNQAIISKVSSIITIPGADNVHVAVVLGEFCVTSKDVQEGDVGILFPEGLQLSQEFVHENNLSRVSENNKDNTKTGFFESSRRVRAQPFLKVRSTALFMPLSSVAYTGVDTDSLAVGASFNELNGKLICTKYMSQKTLRAQGDKKAKERSPKAQAPFFVEHVDTSQFQHNAHRIQIGDLIFFHAKKHGTSGRTSHTQVYRELPWWKRLVNKVAPVFSDFSWEIITGTRRVAMIGSKDKVGFHGSEQFRYDVTHALTPYVEKGMTLYYEIVGYANGRPIMQDHNIKALKDKAYTKKYGENITYKYGCLPDTFRFHVYRITMQGQDGQMRDFSQMEMEKWCVERNIETTIDVYPPMFFDGNLENLKVLVEELTERPDVLTEDWEDASHISEGIILRVEQGESKPLFLKSKSYAFKVCEGIASVEGEADMEDAS